MSATESVGAFATMTRPPVPKVRSRLPSGFNCWILEAEEEFEFEDEPATIIFPFDRMNALLILKSQAAQSNELSRSPFGFSLAI